MPPESGEVSVADGIGRAHRELLAASELQRVLGDGWIDALDGEVRTFDVDAGAALVVQGDLANELYVLLAGRLAVCLGAGDEEQLLGHLDPGATVGEIALLAGDRRSATVRASEPSTVVAISEAGFRQLLSQHPAQAERLARRASERLRQTQLVGQLNALFGRLEPEVLATIADLMEWMPVRAGTRLFAQGDEGDAAYLVVTGRLRAFRVDAAGAEVEVGEIGRGEMAGEMALLEHARRAATVYAVRDSQLVRFSRAAFDAVVSRYPSAGLLVAETVLRRTIGSAERPEQRLSFTVVKGSAGLDAERFARRLTEVLGSEARYVDAATIDAELGVPGLSAVDDDGVGAVRLSYWLEELQERHRFLIYGIDDAWSGWSRRALRWSDHVLVVADASADPTPTSHEAEMWRLVEQQKHPKASLVLLHDADVVRPQGTRAWLDPRPVASHHHVRRGDAGSMARLARLITGTGTSLVLGGGGARGFAHLGVLAALEGLGVPVDMVGGTSIGSIMGALVAEGLTAEQARAVALEQFQRIYDYTFPSVSMIRGQRIDAKLRAHLGDLDIVDLWIPYFCVSANLTVAGACYHDRGPLVPAIRASVAIPGILPPVPFAGELHVDGGILDNVPVEEMRRRNPTGRVIAVDVAPSQGPATTAGDGQSVAGLRALVERRRGTAAPGLMTTVVRSMLAASVRDRDRVVRDGVADLYLDVTVDDAGLLDFDKAEHIANSAEGNVRPVLRRWVETSDEDLGYVRTSASAATVLSNTRRRWRGYSLLLLTVRDLQHRAVRFAAVIAGTAVVLALLFLMTGLIEQFHREPVDTARALGAEAWMVREGVSGAFTSAATMPADSADLVDVDAAPVVIARHALAGDDATDVVIVGYQPDGLGQPEVRDGNLPSRPGEVLLDDSAGVSTGEDITLGGTTFSVAGTTDRTTMFAGMPLVFMAIDDAQDLVYRGQPIATAVLLGDAPGEVPDGFAVRTPEEIATDGLRPLDGAISSLEIIRVLLWFVAAMIIGTMVYLSALERRRDVAVLKAVGSSTVQMGGSIALQAALIALAAALIAAVLQIALVPVFPLEVTVPGRAFYQIPVIAVLVSLLAGAVGLRKAISTDPALAFAGPGS